MANKVYSIFLLKSIGKGVNYSNNFVLRNNNKSFNLKSLFWEVIVKDANGQLLPIDTQTILNYLLTIGGIAGKQISQSFEDFSDITGIAYNGQAFCIQKPRKVNFDNWFFEDECDFNISAVNLDAFIDIVFQCSLVVEIEQL